MGIKIEFPGMYENYVSEAKKLFEAGRVKESIEQFENAYRLKKEGGVNILYVTALFQQDRLPQALEIAEDFLAMYESDALMYQFYVNLLIGNRQFAEARKIALAQSENKSLSAQEREEWKELLHYTEVAEHKMDIVDEKSAEFISERIKEVRGKSYFEQLRLSEDMLALPHVRMIPAIKELLLEPEMNGLVKTRLLEELVNAKLDEELPISWFGEVYQINPSQLSLWSESSAYQQFKAELSAILEQDNVILYESIVSEAKNHFKLLYPMIDEVVKKPIFWAQMYVTMYSFDDQYEELMDDIPEATFKEIYQWLLKLNEASQKIQ